MTMMNLPPACTFMSTVAQMTFLARFPEQLNVGVTYGELAFNINGGPPLKNRQQKFL
ncbi:hypothetical protein BABINDRAFT_159659 [Babjeviella inositovora NRRL Y-12698]|uniref:Uncharacterized protein n=1 Tax=Babjeviella inositovora NRRL Y-12698 TaxID=984486 RepID=A0A1E3R1H9_9ASCO|nr:uncharacterized protein BABINDRAFT_159659 [Babjeviella inositovora NRRL Y-12698]ODQ83222.1 hypothetical protein BABINDRAFT_159659 [Babjeviella inositovora NRRL Y-12698]